MPGEQTLSNNNTIDAAQKPDRQLLAPHHRVAMIIASTREGRRGPMIANWVAAQVRQRPEIDIELIDLLESGPPGTGATAESSVPLGQRLAAADAFIVVTPEYNHGYPAPLKAVIDSFQEEWFAKPVAFVSYGGTSGGLRAVEQLRQIFPEVHAMTVRDSVCFQNFWDLFDEEGRLLDPERHERSAAVMLQRLIWWSEALRLARGKQAYS